MVRNRRQRVRQSGYAVRIGHGSERRLAGRTAIYLPPGGSFKRRIVLGRYLHQEIMRVLPVMNFLATALFATREQIGIATAADGPCLRAEHASEHDAALSHAPLGHAHHPVDAADLVVAASAGLVTKLNEHILVLHELPGTELPMNRVHRRRVR